MRARFRWVECPHPIRGMIAIMPRPEGGEALEASIAELKAQGVNLLVSLLEPEEAALLGLAREPELCDRHGLGFINFPVPDHSTPRSPEEALALARSLAKHVERGQRVVLHCFAGIGRSATLALLTLGVLGMPLHEAMIRLSEARGLRVPETQAQRDWIAMALRDER